ncbi:hypothetical protein [Rhizobium gallicum]|uniref:hypothetical protein n=1 Tax=Rhizobium gallicum TaxID=56730 RepID=UPI001EF7EDDF|nr:hypothetical protein [Rhizobium gallicum]ULJ74203.1 hypothetical protein L2W42_22430 [Rhizobium gallicum]
MQVGENSLLYLSNAPVTVLLAVAEAGEDTANWEVYVDDGMGPEPEEQPRLLVWIGNDDPINAEELGKLIRELAVDYRRQTDGRLVLVRLELGSTFLEFADQAVVYSNYVAPTLVLLEAGKRIGQFYKISRSSLKDRPPISSRSRLR